MSEFYNEIEKHIHNGLDAPRIHPKNLQGFTILTVAPTHTAEEGTIILAYISSKMYLYAFINSSWKKVELT